MSKYDYSKLAHAGVLGMKWGVRKKEESSGGGGSKSTSPASRKKPAAASTTAGTKKPPKDWKGTSFDHLNAQSIRRKSVKQLSNEELRDYMTRVQLEAQYKATLPVSKMDQGKKILGGILLRVGTKVVEKYLFEYVNKKVGGILGAFSDDQDPDPNANQNANTNNQGQGQKGKKQPAAPTPVQPGSGQNPTPVNYGVPQRVGAPPAPTQPYGPAMPRTIPSFNTTPIRNPIAPPPRQVNNIPGSNNGVPLRPVPPMSPPKFNNSLGGSSPFRSIPQPVRPFPGSSSQSPSAPVILNGAWNPSKTVPLSSAVQGAVSPMYPMPIKTFTQPHMNPALGKLLALPSGLPALGPGPGPGSGLAVREGN